MGDVKESVEEEGTSQSANAQEDSDLRKTGNLADEFILVRGETKADAAKYA